MKSADERPRATLVIVDDSEEVRTLVRARVELSGMFDVVGEAGDGEEAIGLAYRLQPAVMMLDTSMPVMDGLEALPAILSVAPETRVVIYTGFEERALARRAQEMGAADYIEKSLPIDELPHRLWASVGDLPPPPPRPLRLVTSATATEAVDQALLDEHLERFRELFTRAAIGMATLTLGGSIVRANPALAAMMRCVPGDLIGVDYGVLTRGLGDLLDEGLAAIGERGEQVATFEHSLPIGDDPPTVRVTLAPIRDTMGRPLYIFAQVQDISSEQRAEDRLRTSDEPFRLLVTAVRDYAIFMLDPTGRVVSWNPGAERIKGYRSDEIVGQSHELFYAPPERADGRPARTLDAALREGAHTDETWLVRKDGTCFWASVVTTAMFDESGRHVGFATVTRDQTEQRAHLEHQQQAVEEQANVLAVTAHELRTPTAVIDGAAAMLSDHWHELENAGRERLLASIAASNQRLGRLATDLSTASRLHRGTLELQRGDVSLAHCVDSAVARERAARPDALITVERDDATFYADPARIAQVLDNLLDNALRHGAGPVDVRATASDDTVRIVVSDSGPGVAPELLPRLFQRFSIAGATGGTGLGLYLVDQISRQHGGMTSYLPRQGAERPAFVVEVPRANRAG